MNIRLLLAAAISATGASLVPAEENPVALYHFDEGSGSVAHDASPHHHDGRIEGGGAWAAAGVAGTALLFNGQNSVRIPSAEGLGLNGPHSISAWVRGRASPLHFVEGYPDIDAFYFQVCGDKIYIATFSDPFNHAFPTKPPTLRGQDIPHIYTGTADISLGGWHFVRRTAAPYSGFEPKMQVTGDRIYYEYTGLDSHKVQQIWTAESARDGSGYRPTQRTAEVDRDGDLPPDRPDLPDSKKVGDALYRVDHGAVAVAGGKLYIAYPTQDGHNVWQFVTAICTGDRTETFRRTTDHGFIPSAIQVAGDRVYYLFPKGNEVFETYSHALIRGANRGLKTVEGMYVASSDRAGRDWRIIRKIAGPCPAGNPASFQVSNGRIYAVWSQLERGDSGHSKLFTGVMDLDGGHFQKWQRTVDPGFLGTSIAGGIQVVGGRIYYAYNQRLTELGYREINAPGADRSRTGSWSVWAAESNLDGSGWITARMPTRPDSVMVGYKGLVVVGAKRYLAPMDAPDRPRIPAFGHGPGMLGFDGANIVSKGDAYGLGLTARGLTRGFVNAGQDYLFRGDGPADTSGAIADAAEPLAGDTWYHLAEVYDGRNLNVYVDGKLQARTPYAAPPAANPFPLVIGDGFVGYVDEVGLYDRALSGAEVQELYRQFR